MDRILVNAVLNPEGLRCLEEAGYETVIVPEADVEGSHAAARDCVGMVANASLILDDRFFQSCPRLKVVGRMGVGYDTVDVAAAARHGVRVVNTPLAIIEPVAEHAVMLLLALARRLLPGDRAVREGRWREPGNMPGPELKGKVLGLVGFGNTGRRVAEIASLGIGMRIVYHDLVERPDAEKALGARRLPLDEVLSASDFVSVHVILGPATRNLIDARALGLMKPGAFLVNLARGPVVDEAALVDALRSGRLAGAGLDVYQVEPPGKSNPLLSLPNVVLTPHVGGASIEGKHGCSMVVLDILRVLRGEEPVHAVSPGA
jgi:phosphoglycerate dehydrogenase-like enzyme